MAGDASGRKGTVTNCPSPKAEQHQDGSFTQSQSMHLGRNGQLEDQGHFFQFDGIERLGQLPRLESKFTNEPRRLVRVIRLGGLARWREWVSEFS